MGNTYTLEGWYFKTKIQEDYSYSQRENVIRPDKEEELYGWVFGHPKFVDGTHIVVTSIFVFGDDMVTTALGDVYNLLPYYPDRHRRHLCKISRAPQ